MKTHQRSLKERQRQEREQLILQTAEEVLLEKGYRDTSMDEIAARVGIAKGTLYLHFARKEDLVLAFFEQQLQPLLDCIEQAEAKGCSAQEKLEVLIAAMFNDPLGKRAQLIGMFHTAEEFKSTLVEQPDNIFLRVSRKVTALMDEGKANGEFDAQLPTSVMVNTFFHMVSPKGYRHSHGAGDLSLLDVRHAITLIYFRGIGGHIPTNEPKI